MLLRFGVDGLSPEWPAAIVCIGTFDGVHRGHQEVIGAAVAQARKDELPSVVVTFDRHPLAILAPEKNPPDVGTLGQNLEQFEQLGVDVAVVLKFDPALADTPAEAFFENVLQKALHAEKAVVGHDFAFGKGRQGTPEWLAERLPTQVIPPFELEGHRVSSSRVRKAISEGDVQTAERLLDRRWAQEGVVVSGQKLGRTLGFPTINLARAGNQVLPADGVYAGQAQTTKGTFKAAIGVGLRPTIGEGPRTIEAFLIDYPGESLYGTPVRLSYRKRLRDDRKFDSLEALKEQMAQDVAQAAQVE